jgi:cyclophilin family peptidyl-prolyl cis-trans isomerase
VDCRFVQSVASVGLLVLISAAGCGRSGDDRPTAIKGSPESPASSPGETAESTAPRRQPQKPLSPEVLIETSMGVIRVRLNAEKSVLTTRHFLSYVAASHYDETLIHQVSKGRGIVAGGYDLRRVEKPAPRHVRNEARDNRLKNRRGTISMVRPASDIDGAGCQFFINAADNPALDYRDDTPEGYGYCVFGEIVEGMDVVDRISNVPLHNVANFFDQTPVEPILIKSIRQIR